MTREEKSQVIEELTLQLADNANIYLADISGLNAGSTSDLRRICFKSNVKLAVIKNTLLAKAMEASDKDFGDLPTTLKGNTSVMYSETGNAPAKVIKAFRKKDTVVLLYPLNKTKSIERKPVSYLQEVVKIPFTFNTLQDLILGNPIFMDSSNILSYKSNNNQFQVSLMGRLFKNLVILNNDNSKVLHLKLDDVDLNQHRTCDIAFNDHINVGQYQFPLKRAISIVAQQKLDIQMEVKEFTFNEPVKYTFAIPKIGLPKTVKRK